MKTEKVRQYISIALLGGLFFALLGQVAAAFPTATWSMVGLIVFFVFLAALGIGPSWVAMKMGKGDEFSRVDGWASFLPSGLAVAFIVGCALFGVIWVGG